MFDKADVEETLPANSIAPTRMSFLNRNRAQARRPSLTHVEEGLTGTEHPTKGDHAEEQSIDDNSDNNHNFWKLFLKEGTTVAQYEVNIWKTELDSLLVFAGLFAAVVSAFLVDLRSRLNPDPLVTRQLAALTEIVALLRQDTSPANADSDKPSSTVVIAGYLWYASLVVTLLGALAGVLAQRWLAAHLRESPKNAADHALVRWRRDNAARIWHMGTVITGVPLLTQIALALFLIGFVFQSLDDNLAIGVEVGVLVGIGLFAYIVLTFLPWFYPDCPFQTPIAQLLHLVRTKENHVTDTDSKIEILASRLTRSSNDEIFCAAASMLDVKLDSDDSEKWYKGVNRPTFKNANALSARLTRFAHRIQTMMAEESPLPILKNAAGFGANGSTFVATVSSPMEQGVICLRVLLRSIEASILASDGNRSAWIDQIIDAQWKSSKAFPDAWRLLSWSSDITRLVVKKDDYDRNDIAAIDWDDMIRKPFTDLTLRSIAGTSVCRGLLHGKENVRGVCALGLAMFIEIEATSIELPKQIFFDKDFAVENGKVILESLWSELVKIWNNAVDPVLFQAKRFGKLVEHDIYHPGINFTIQTLVKQLDDDNWQLREQAADILVKLSELDTFQKVKKIEGVISKLVAKLEDDDPDVRAAVIAALQAFINYELYQPDIESSIPTIIGQMDSSRWIIRLQTVDLVVKLSEIEMFRQKLKIAGIIAKLMTRIEDDDSDVRAAVFTAFQTFSNHELYQSDIALSIPTITERLGNNFWSIRQRTVDLVVKLSGTEMFRQELKLAGTIAKLAAKLEDDDSDVRDAAFTAFQTFSNYELYQPDIELSIPTIIGQLDNDNWIICLQTVDLVVKLSEIEVFRQKFKMAGIIAKLVTKVEDEDSDVHAAVFTAFQTFSNHELYQPDIESSISTVIGQLDNDRWSIRLRTVHLVMKLSETELYQSDIKSSIPTIVEHLDHDRWGIRQQAVITLANFSKYGVYQEIIIEQGVITKLIAKFKNDDDEEVRTATVESMITLGTQSYFMSTMISEEAVSHLVDILLCDSHYDVRSAAVKGISALNEHEPYGEAINSTFLTRIPTIIEQLKAENRTDRQLSVEILAEFATNELFQKALKSEKAIPQLAANLADTFDNVRSGAQSIILDLSVQEFYQNDIKSTIPAIVKHLEGENWAARQQAIQILVQLYERPVFQEALKTEGLVTKVIARLEDDDEDVRAEALKALSTLGAKKDLLQELMAIVPKLVARLTEDNGETHSSVPYNTLLVLWKPENATEFLQTIMSTLNSLEKSVRVGVYKLLIELKDLRASTNELPLFLNDIDKAICELLTQMKDQEMSAIRRSIAILAETAGKGLIGNDLKTRGTSNKSARDAVETVVRSKLVYDKNLPDPNEVVIALSRLAKHEIFRGCLKPAIPGLIEALSNNDWHIWSAAVGALSALSEDSELHKLLVPALTKLIQQLSRWDEDEEYSFDLTSHSQMDSLTEDLLSLVTNLEKSGHLTMNNRIALASSLRMAVPVPPSLEIRVCKLEMAAVLQPDTYSDRECESFFTAIFGNGNVSLKSKLSKLFATA